MYFTGIYFLVLGYFEFGGHQDFRFIDKLKDQTGEMLREVQLPYFRMSPTQDSTSLAALLRMCI
jgi:hypothetical protein